TEVATLCTSSCYFKHLKLLYQVPKDVTSTPEVVTSSTLSLSLKAPKAITSST
ncbi:8412_t:CDS:2, partial [Gigaspora rosea]